MVNQPSSQSTRRAGRLWRWFLYFCAAFVLLIVFLLIYNNVSFVRSQSKLQARMDTARESVTNWIYTHPEAVVSNPSLMFMIYDMERMSGDPRLQTVLEDYDRWLVRTPSKALNPVWRRFVHPDIAVPEINDSQLHTEGEEPRWDAFAVAPDRGSSMTPTTPTCFRLPNTSGARGSTSSWPWPCIAISTAARPNWTLPSITWRRRLPATRITISG